MRLRQCFRPAAAYWRSAATGFEALSGDGLLFDKLYDLAAVALEVDTFRGRANLIAGAATLLTFSAQFSIFSFPFTGVAEGTSVDKVVAPLFVLQPPVWAAKWFDRKHIAAQPSTEFVSRWT